MIQAQAYLQAAVRFIIVMGCAGIVLFALEMSAPEYPKATLCNIHTTECFDQLGLRR